MAEALVTFLPVAALLTVIPGPATALVAQSAFRGGSGEALRTIAGNSLGILIWALFAAFGLAAVVAASAGAFTALKLVCGVVLVYLGAQAIWRSRRSGEAAGLPAPRSRHPFRAGVATSVSNPKLAVFVVALFPQFVPAGEPVLPFALRRSLCRSRAISPTTPGSPGWWCAHAARSPRARSCRGSSGSPAR